MKDALPREPGAGRPRLLLQRGLGWDAPALFAPLGARARCRTISDALVAAIVAGGARRATTSWSCPTAASAASTSKLLAASAGGGDRLPARLQLLAAVAQGAGAAALHGGARARGARTPARRCRPLAKRCDRRGRERTTSASTVTASSASSLGGFYATYLAEKHGCRAVLINPAIDPHVGLRAYLGTAAEPAHRRALRAHRGAPAEWQRARTSPRITPQRYLLSSRPATRCSTTARRCERTPAREQIVIAGGDHSLQSFPSTSPRILEFAGWCMNVLYEEDGDLKVGAVLAAAPASFQVESPHGRRSQGEGGERAAVASSGPRGGRAARRGASKFAAELDTDFSGSAAAAREFGFAGAGARVRRPRADAGRGGGRAAQAALGADVLLPPGQGAASRRRRRTRSSSRSPGVEKKKRVQEQIAAWAERARAVRVPAGDRARCARAALRARPQQASRPRRSSRPARRPGLSPARLFERCGLLADSHDYHLSRFLHEFFPRGAGFPGAPAAGAARRPAARRRSRRSAWTTSAPPRSTTRSRSRALPDGELRVGIHIAAPGARLRARLAARRDRPRAAVDRLHAGPASSPCCPTDVIDALLARSRRRAAGGIALPRCRRRDYAVRGAPYAGSSACRWSPTCATRSTTC